MAERPEHQDAGSRDGTSGATSFRIFLNYRREDASGHAGRLYDSLLHGGSGGVSFRKEQVFMDIDTIAPGVDFRRVIEDAVGSCDVFIAVIGRRWLDATDGEGRRRVDKGNDFVRLEIEAALARDVPVVPVLVQGAEMPSAEELPESLDAFAHRNAVELSDARWSFDVGRLTAWLTTVEEEKARRERAERERAEEERLAHERAELAAVDQAERERQERERHEQEEAERAKRERQALEAAERAALERRKQEQAERERQERQAAERGEREHLAREPEPARVGEEPQKPTPGRRFLWRSKRVIFPVLAVALLVCAAVVALIVVRTGTPTFALTTDLIAYSQSRVPLVLVNKQDGENALEEAQGSVLFERIYVFEDEDKADDLSQFVTGHREDDVDHLEPASQPGFYWGVGADSSRTVLVKQYGANIVLIVPAIFFDELPPPDDLFWDLDRMLSDFVASL